MDSPTRGQRRWWQSWQQGSLSPRVQRFILKYVIVTVVFPVLVLAFIELWRPLLHLLAFVFPQDTTFTRVIAVAVMIVAGGVTLWGAFGICRRMWPQPKGVTNATGQEPPGGRAK